MPNYHPVNRHNRQIVRRPDVVWTEDTSLPVGDVNGNLHKEPTIVGCALCGEDIQFDYHNPERTTLAFCCSQHKIDYHNLFGKKNLTTTRFNILDRVSTLLPVPPSASVDSLVEKGVMKACSHPDSYILTDLGWKLLERYKENWD